MGVYAPNSLNKVFENINSFKYINITFTYYCLVKTRQQMTGLLTSFLISLSWEPNSDISSHESEL